MSALLYESKTELVRKRYLFKIIHKMTTIYFQIFCSPVLPNFSGLSGNAGPNWQHFLWDPLANCQQDLCFSANVLVEIITYTHIYLFQSVQIYLSQSVQLYLLQSVQILSIDLSWFIYQTIYIYLSLSISIILCQSAHIYFSLFIYLNLSISFCLFSPGHIYLSLFKVCKIKLQITKQVLQWCFTKFHILFLVET